MGETTGRKPGWYEERARPGIERYWDGREWSTDIAPRAKPTPVWKQARMIALGILIAAAVIFTAYRLSQPSDLECSLQALDVASGERVSVESACVGRF